MSGTEIFEAIDRVSSPEELLSLLSGYFGQFGFGAVCVVLPRANELGESDLLYRGMPEEWMQRYLLNDFGAIDPIPVHTMRSNNVERLYAVLERFSRTAQQRAYLSEFRNSGVSDGLAIPTHGHLHARGFFGLAQIENDRLDSVNISLIHAVAQHAHHRMDQLTLTSTATIGDLSPRELEILRWIAAGKSNPDIATILDISMPTVATHMKRLFAKLGVHDRVSAALAGFKLGLVH